MPNKLLQQISKMEKQYEALKKDFASDGNISKDERTILVSVGAKISALKEKAMEGDIVGSGEMPAMTVTVDMVEFKDKDCEAAFNQALKDWAQDAQIALNAVRTYFQSTDKPEGLTAGNVLDVVELIMISANPEAKAILSTVKTITSVVTAIYKAGLPKTPSLNDIQSEWFNALSSYGSRDHKKEFEAFIEDYKKKTGAKGDKTPKNLFMQACRDTGKSLPTQSIVQKQFLKEVLKHVEDSWDWDDESGVAEIDMVELVSTFSQPSGQLDDVSARLMEAIKTVWKGDRAMDLPVKMRFTIRNVNWANMCEIERSSKDPGSIGFKHKDGKKDIFEAFMKKKAYAIPMVKHLKADS